MMRDPYEEIEKFMKEMEKLFGKFREVDILRAGGFERPKVEISEEKDKYTYIFEIPGVSKDDINIEIKDNALEITAKREERKEEKKKGYYYSERSSLGFYRVVPLPPDASDNIKAKYKNGLLIVEIAKEKKKRGKKIKVE